MLLPTYASYRCASSSKKILTELGYFAVCVSGKILDI